MEILNLHKEVYWVFSKRHSFRRLLGMYSNRIVVTALNTGTLSPVSYALNNFMIRGAKCFNKSDHLKN